MTRTAHYAVRALAELHRRGTAMSSVRMAAETGIPPAYLRKVLGRLAQAGIVAGARGHRGGYRLVPGAGACRVAAVVALVDDQFPAPAPAADDAIGAIAALPGAVLRDRLGTLTIADLVA
jgi:Rrf2 family iron-sulfur cluster assembly transcriptional regulator